MEFTNQKNYPQGIVSTLAGNGTEGYVDGNASKAEFARPFRVAVDKNNNVYVADQGNNCIRMITPGGVVSTVAGNQALPDYADGDALQAEFNSPDGLTIDKAGNIYVADTGNNRIRKIAFQ